jgi:hypothetical protein
MKKKIKHRIEGLSKNNSPFVVPDGYFDTFAERIMDRIELENAPKKRFSFGHYLKPALAMAASFTIIFFMIYIPVHIFTPQQTTNGEEIIFNSPDFMDLYYISDHAIINAFEDKTENDYDEDFLETILLASMNEYDLTQINN